MKSIIAFLAAGLMAINAWAAHAVNVNTASAEEIAEALTGIGVSKAEAIVAHRQLHGEFKHADELVKVKGIGLRTVDLNRDYIRVSGAAEKPAKNG